MAGVPSRRLTTVLRADTEATVNKPFPERVERIEIGDPQHNSELAKEDWEELHFHKASYR